MPNTATVSRRVRYLEIACYILLLCFVIPIKIDSDDLSLNQYKTYVERFNKTFANDVAFNKGLQAFKKSLEAIEQLNGKRTKNSSAYYGLTKFSDMLPEDFLISLLQPKFSENFMKSSIFLTKINDSSSHPIFQRTIPKKVDWREKNVVSAVKNQKNCGACWAFAVVGIAESMYAIKTGDLKPLSVQEMIDCAENNFGCDGGDVYTLLDWIKSENVSIVKEEEYPLVLKEEKCKKMSKGGIQISDFECGSFINHEDVIVQLLANYGPVAVAINAQSWQNYVNGIIQYHCDSNFTQLNHAVQIVGYDLTAEIPHYIIRNSWGKDFGDYGYLYIAIDKNLCGLATEVCIVKVL